MKKCDVCGKNKQIEMEMFGEKMFMPIKCKCEQEQAAKENRQFKLMQKHQRTRELRQECFKNPELAKFTFQCDDERLKSISDAMRRYVDKFDEIKQKNIGLLLYGGVGGGKTFYAACIANALIDKGESVIMRNLSITINELQDSFGSRQAYLDKLASVSLLILDDFGIERETTYMQEQVYNVINARYESKKPLILTTNISIDNIAKPKDITHGRTYDRVLEMCHPIEFKGLNRRREKTSAIYTANKEFLGV